MLSIHGEITAGMLFFLFFFFSCSPPVSSHSHPLSSVSSSLSSPSILFLANFNPLPCSSSPASRFCGDARQVHRVVSRRRPSRAWHVRRALCRPCMQDVLQNGSVLVLLLCSGMPPLYVPSSPPPFPLLPPPNLSFLLLISPSSFFSLPALIPLTFISDMLWYFMWFYTNDCVLPAYYARANGRADTPPRVGMIPSPFNFSLFLVLCFYW